MGCCCSEIKLDEPEIFELSQRNMLSSRKLGSDDFNELSLSSHGKEFPPPDNSTNQFQVSGYYYTRSTSVSLHHTDLETAFLQSPHHFL